MLYELTLNYDNGTTKKEIDIMNCQTGEIIAMW